MLRPRSAGGCGGGDDLLLRVHLLPALRRDGAARALPQLRRGAGAAADPAGGEARQIPGRDGPQGETRGLRNRRLNCRMARVEGVASRPGEVPSPIPRAARGLADKALIYQYILGSSALPKG